MLGTGNKLGREMRALQNDGYCKFYLAGHSALRKATTPEGGPFLVLQKSLRYKGWK